MTESERKTYKNVFFLQTTACTLSRVKMEQETALQIGIINCQRGEKRQWRKLMKYKCTKSDNHFCRMRNNMFPVYGERMLKE